MNIKGLANFLREKRESLTEKVRINVEKERRGYSDITWWMETVSFDEIEIVDFDKLMTQIEEFENSFKEEK